jgi:hypothetical protein
VHLSYRQEQARDKSRACLFFHKNYEKMQTAMRKQIIKSVILYVIGFSILLTTDPQKLPLIVLIIPFIIFFLALYLTVKIFIAIFGTDIDKLNKKSSIQAAIIASFPIICLLLLSIGQFSLRVFITFFLLYLVLWFYGNRFSAR